jgi:hypothetical protein
MKILVEIIRYAWMLFCLWISGLIITAWYTYNGFNHLTEWRIIVLKIIFIPITIFFVILFTSVCGFWKEVEKWKKKLENYKGD